MRDISAKRRATWSSALLVVALCVHPVHAEIEVQPLASNIQRVQSALEFLGAPLPAETVSRLAKAVQEKDAGQLQAALDKHVLLVVGINPEVRVKVNRGRAPGRLRQHSYTPVLLKVLNEGTSQQTLTLRSPQAGPGHAGAALFSLKRQAQPHLKANENKDKTAGRFLHLEMFDQPPMTDTLSGFPVEYVIALIYSSESGRREATLQADLNQGNQDLGFRGETPVLFDIQPAVAVTLHVRDENGNPSTGRFLFRDDAGHIYPPQARRQAPDLFFQKQIYRHDGQIVLLPPGTLTMFYGRGPEYRWQQRTLEIPQAGTHAVSVKLQRWIDPMQYGFYSGDHHIHAAGCAHYTHPTEGIGPEDMFLQVKGEGLNVGSILTWGPGFDVQHKYFSPAVDRISEPFTVLKYDIEVSGFGSQALGHVCLLNLKEQIYPGAKGIDNWPTWTTPVLRWARKQGAVTGYAHSASGLQIHPGRAAGRLLEQLDTENNGHLSAAEAARGLMTEPFGQIDFNQDGVLNRTELEQSIDRAADRLPNLAIPELNSVGAQEIFVTTALGLCDFISAMDTARLPEWNCWYHLLNCGFPLKVSGETDFPCMSGTRVGQGRVYVQLGKVDRVDYADWCRNLAAGRSYVSDGYAHALEFSVNDKTAGDTLELDSPGEVTIRARVAFSAETPLEVAYGTVMPLRGQRLVGDTVVYHTWSDPEPPRNQTRKVELVVNAEPVAHLMVPADGNEHGLTFKVRLKKSSWVALRQFPQLHTNPVTVRIGNKPIRASRNSALWSIQCIRQLWNVRKNAIKPEERDAARKTFGEAIAMYEAIASEAME